MSKHKDWVNITLFLLFILMKPMLYALDLGVGFKIGYPSILYYDNRYKPLPIDSTYSFGVFSSYNINNKLIASVNIDYCDYFNSGVWWCYTADHVESDAHLTDLSLNIAIKYTLASKDKKLVPYLGLNYGVHKIQLKYLLGPLQGSDYVRTKENSFSYPTLMFGLIYPLKTDVIVFDFTVTSPDENIGRFILLEKTFFRNISLSYQRYFSTESVLNIFNKNK